MGIQLQLQLSKLQLQLAVEVNDVKMKADEVQVVEDEDHDDGMAFRLSPKNRLTGEGASPTHRRPSDSKPGGLAAKAKNAAIESTKDDTPLDAVKYEVPPELLTPCTTLADMKTRKKEFASERRKAKFHLRLQQETSDTAKMKQVEQKIKALDEAEQKLTDDIRALERAQKVEALKEKGGQGK